MMRTEELQLKNIPFLRRSFQIIENDKMIKKWNGSGSVPVHSTFSLLIESPALFCGKTAPDFCRFTRFLQEPFLPRQELLLLRQGSQCLQLLLRLLFLLISS